MRCRTQTRTSARCIRHHKSTQINGSVLCWIMPDRGCLFEYYDFDGYTRWILITMKHRLKPHSTWHNHLRELHDSGCSHYAVAQNFRQQRQHAILRRYFIQHKRVHHTSEIHPPQFKLWHLCCSIHQLHESVFERKPTKKYSRENNLISVVLVQNNFKGPNRSFWWSCSRVPVTKMPNNMGRQDR